MTAGGQGVRDAAVGGEPERASGSTTTLFSLTDEAEMGHIELSRDADLVVVAPATANLLAKMANGLADDLASTLLLATDKRTLMAPAMNLRMWLHPATQRNRRPPARGDGVLVRRARATAPWPAASSGPGRMAEPLEIVAAIEAALAARHRSALAARRARDPARLGRSLAGPARRRDLGADPRADRSRALHRQPLLGQAGPRDRGRGGRGRRRGRAGLRSRGDRPIPPGVRTCTVETAREMLRPSKPRCRPTSSSPPRPSPIGARGDAATDKIKKQPARPRRRRCTLVENPDILATVARAREGPPALVVGFAAETRGPPRPCRQAQARQQGVRHHRRQRRRRGRRRDGRRPQHRPPRDRATASIDWPTLEQERGRAPPGRAFAAMLRARPAVTLTIPVLPPASRRRVCRCRPMQSAGAAGLDLVAAMPEASRAGPGARRARSRADGLRHGAAARLGGAGAAAIGPRAAPRRHDAERARHDRQRLSRRDRRDPDQSRPEPFEIRRGARIAQLVFARVERIAWAEASDLDATARGAGGFGSTGSSERASAP